METTQMKAVVSFFSIFASIVSTLAVIITLKWRNIQDSPVPNPIETPGKKALRIGAAIWLVLFGVVMLLVTGALIMPAIVKLFV